MMMSWLLFSKKSYVFKYMPPHDHDINHSMIIMTVMPLVGMHNLTETDRGMMMIMI